MKNITKIEKYKILIMTEHKTDMSITKIEKYKKTWSTKYQKINTTATDKYKKQPNTLWD